MQNFIIFIKKPLSIITVITLGVVLLGWFFSSKNVDVDGDIGDNYSIDNQTSNQVFVKYNSWEFGNQQYSVSILHNGNFSGWKGTEKDGIPLSGTLTIDKVENLKSILTRNNFFRLSDIKKSDDQNLICEGGSSISINFNSQTRQFGVDCECQNENPGKSCQFYNELEGFLVGVINDSMSESVCEKTQNAYSKDACYDEVALKKINPSLCEQIKDQSIKNHCYAEIAEKTSDVTFCKNLVPQKDKTVDELKSRCFFRVAFFIKDTAKRKTTCDQVLDRPTGSIHNESGFRLTREREECYFYLFKETNDVSLCELFSSENRLACLKQSAPQKISIQEIESICNKEDGFYRVSACYGQWALTLEDASLCEKDTANRDGCLASVAYQTLDINTCDKITITSERDQCYIGVAVRTSKIEYCDRISNSESRKFCQQQVR